MMLVLLIVWPLLGGLLAWLVGGRSKTWSRWVALVTLTVLFLALLGMWWRSRGETLPGPWLLEFSRPWIPQLGIQFALAMDGVSLLLALLTALLGVMGVAASWAGVQEHVGFFHFNLLWLLAAMVGVFLAVDLALFYVFWEMMLVPLYFLIGIWGHERRTYATLKFFLFTQAGSLFLLLAILGLYFAHGQSSGVYTFRYEELLGTALAPGMALGLMLGFFAAFAVKLPAVPLHTWLADAHTEAPTAGSVVLAGLVLKAAAYGMLRFLVPLFPHAALDFAPVAMVLGVIGILYGAVMAFAQRDLKRLVAYTSISHMGFVLLGIFAWNGLALQGAVVVMLAHGISTGALFILVGDLQERVHTRDLERMGGLWSTVPRMGGAGLLFALASLGLPGLGNFVGEFLVLLGVYQVSVPFAILASLGFIVSTVYSLWMVQRTFFGPNEKQWRLPDSDGRETALMLLLIIAIVWLGLNPQPVLNTVLPALERLQQYTAAVQRWMAPAAVLGSATPPALPPMPSGLGRTGGVP